MDQSVTKDFSTKNQSGLALRLLRSRSIALKQIALASGLAARTVTKAFNSPDRCHPLTVSAVRSASERLLVASGAKFDSLTLWEQESPLNTERAA